MQEIFSDFYSRQKLHLTLLNQVMLFFNFDHAFFIFFFKKNNKTIFGSTNLRTHKPKKKSSAKISEVGLGFVPSLIMFHIKGKIFHRGNSRGFTYISVSICLPRLKIPPTYIQFSCMIDNYSLINMRQLQNLFNEAKT